MQRGRKGFCVLIASPLDFSTFFIFDSVAAAADGATAPAGQDCLGLLVLFPSLLVALCSLLSQVAGSPPEGIRIQAPFAFLRPSAHALMSSETRVSRGQRPGLRAETQSDGPDMKRTGCRLTELVNHGCRVGTHWKYVLLVPSFVVVGRQNTGNLCSWFVCLLQVLWDEDVGHQQDGWLLSFRP